VRRFGAAWSCETKCRPLGIVMIGTILSPGRCCSRSLKSATPLSFWGGVDAQTGKVVDRESDIYGQEIRAQVLILPRTRGSSSSSSVLLELIAVGCGPAGIVMTEPDAIIVVGSLVAREMGYPPVPVLCVSAEDYARLPTHVEIQISEDGLLEWRS
jgi:predicted aconitase with swiveling domain